MNQKAEVNEENEPFTPLLECVRNRIHERSTPARIRPHGCGKPHSVSPHTSEWRDLEREERFSCIRGHHDGRSSSRGDGSAAGTPCLQAPHHRGTDGSSQSDAGTRSILSTPDLIPTNCSIQRGRVVHQRRSTYPRQPRSSLRQVEHVWRNMETDHERVVDLRRYSRPWV